MKKLENYDTYEIPISEIHVDKDFNCRGSFTTQSVADLAASISLRGMDVPVSVQPAADTGLKLREKYRLLAGFRRFHACRDILKYTVIPARIHLGLSDQAAAQLNFRENIERKNLNPIEEAQWLAKHFDGKSLRDISKVVGRDTRWVHQRLRLASLPVECHHKFAAGLLTLLDVDSISQLRTAKEQIRAAELLIEAKKDRDKQRVTKLRKARAFQPRKTKSEIGAMMGRLMDMGHSGLVTRFGAWCAGWISDKEFEADLKIHLGKNS
jgi:ParB/RepB/Spo0J family partition protein